METERGKKMKRIRSLLCAALACLMLCSVTSVAATPAEEEWETTILFTHDLHSHFLPQPTDGGESGGYARLKTVIDAERAKHPDALVLDGGDFSIGSLVQTLYTTEGAELRTMGALGYDATTIGNHEFDHKGHGFGEMLNAAVDSGEALPALLEANYAPADDNPDKAYIQAAMDRYGVEETMLLERGGVTYGIFGLMGVDSNDCAPTSGFTLTDAADAAKHCVASLKEQGAQVIICLSHSGTDENQKKSEDELLAKAVDGIDVIVSGHTHSILTEPLVVNDTLIVSCGPYCENLGVLTVKGTYGKAEKTVEDYRLIPIDQTQKDDAQMAQLVEQWKDQVGETYLARYGLTYDQVLTTTNFTMIKPTYGYQENNCVGMLVADAFQWAVDNLEATHYDGHTITVTADGVLRADLAAGNITTSMAFDVLSMGVGEDGTSGFPLVDVYLTGKELKAAMEVDASVTPIMPAAQLYMSGVAYSFNTNRMFFNRVYDAKLVEPFVGYDCGMAKEADIDDEQLYRVVTGMYSAQMLGTVKSKSMGLLSLEPKDEYGELITDFSTRILYDKDGNEIKEWYALAAYLEQMGKQGMPEYYANAEQNGSKQVNRGFVPGQLLVGWNWISWVVLAVVLLLCLLIFLVIRTIVRRRRIRKGYRR